MKLYNLKDHNEQVSFAQAIKQGTGKQQGLFFPLELPEFELTGSTSSRSRTLSPAAAAFCRPLSAKRYRKRR